MERLVETFHFESSYSAVGRNKMEVSINWNSGTVQVIEQGSLKGDSYLIVPVEESQDNHVLHLFHHMDHFSSFYIFPHALLVFCIFTTHRIQAHVGEKETS